MITPSFVSRAGSGPMEPFDFFTIARGETQWQIGKNGDDSSSKLRPGAYGNCQIDLRRDEKDVSPSLTRFHAEIADPADHLPTDQSCTEQLASVPQFLLTNLAAASAILNALALHLSDCLHYSELAFDVADGPMRPLPLTAPKLARPSAHSDSLVSVAESSRHTPCAVSGGRHTACACYL